MEVKEIENIKSYLSFIKTLYKNDKFFKDNKSDVIEMVCNPESPFNQNTFQKMAGVFSDEKIKCQTILMQNKNMPETLMMSFFEAVENSKKEVEYLIEYAKKQAKNLGCKKLIVSMNGHCNYGLGILTEGFGDYPDFAQAYNPNYYKNFFKNGFSEHKFISYKNTLLFSGERTLKFKKRLAKSGFSFLKYDSKSKDFSDAIKIYTDLNNKIFEAHSYYYKREYKEDLELFESMKPILKDKNLIIAMLNNEPIGFVLWYPDYNQLINAGESVGLKVFLKYNLLKQKPKNILLTEIGVLPQFENKGLILALFLEVYDYLFEKYDKSCNVVSGWISNENLKSKNLVKHVLEEPYKEYCVYETDV